MSMLQLAMMGKLPYTNCVMLSLPIQHLLNPSTTLFTHLDS